jgi:hypothetical protein
VTTTDSSMDRRFKNIFLLILAVILPGQGQQTWKGLRFGMTLTQVRSFFPDLSKAVGDHRLSNCSISYEARPLTIESFRFLPGFCFEVGPNPKLEMVVLRAEIPSAKRPDPFGAESLFRSLTEKYGKPVSYSGDCEETRLRGSDGFCDLTWRARGQSITGAAFWGDGELGGLMISYRKISGSL